MTTGTKSLLFGVHQFIWHPITVWMAWIWLFRKPPTFRETVCIIVHDWGYLGKAQMDDEKGIQHPEVGAAIAGKLFGFEYYDLCLLHSRHYAYRVGREPSPLCWADKLSIIFEPWWLYLPRAWASGELTEYRKNCDRTGDIPIFLSHRDWYRRSQAQLRNIGMKKLSVVTAGRIASLLKQVGLSRKLRS